jgi:hypothetical protein
MNFNAIRALTLSHSLPWLKVEADNSLSLIVDNHLLSTHRACPDGFMLQHVQGMHPKPGYGVPNLRRWYLDFGVVFHIMLEKYYKHFRDKDFDLKIWATEEAWKQWDAANIDGIYKAHPEYIAIGGFKGFAGLLIQYAYRFVPENEKLRVIGTEVSFGKDKDISLFKSDELNIFLAGRMDVIVDDGYFIMPMDHKTKGRFSGDVSDNYIIDEGPTGYIYALKKILPDYIPEEQILKRGCSRILMNVISKAVPASAPMDRFRRFCILKSEEQLERYRQRMVNSCYDLLENLSRYALGSEVPRDTTHCLDLYHAKCPYFDVHRQSDKSGEQATLSNGFIKLPIWDTENISLTNGN